MIGPTLAAEHAQSMQALQYHSIMQQERTSRCTSPKVACLTVKIPPVDVVRVLVPVLFKQTFSLDFLATVAIC
jgi:hypothetical protein